MKVKTLLTITVIVLSLGSLAFSALDLKWIGSITITPDPSCIGSSASFSAIFRTQGGSVTNLKVTYGVDLTGPGHTELGHKDYASIAQGENTTISFNWTPYSAAKSAWFTLDPDGTAGDSDYNNNTLIKIFTPVSCPYDRPNLKPNVSYSPSSFEAGDAVTFTISVTNDGVGPSAPCKMTLKEGTVLKHEFDVPAVNQGHTSPAQTYVWTAVCIAVINVMVDSNSANPGELDESDNTWSKTMNCLGGGLAWDWAKNKSIAEKIPLPQPCLTCPPWRDMFTSEDPVELLGSIGKRLGEGEKFDDVKGDWLKFLKNNRGLNPNTALKLIFDEASKIGRQKCKTRSSIQAFQNSLNAAVSLLINSAKDTLI